MHRSELKILSFEVSFFFFRKIGFEIGVNAALTAIPRNFQISKKHSNCRDKRKIDKFLLPSLRLLYEYRTVRNRGLCIQVDTS